MSGGHINYSITEMTGIAMDSFYWMTFMVLAFVSAGSARGATIGTTGNIEKPRIAAIQTIERALKEEESEALVEERIERLRSAASGVLPLTKQNQEVQTTLARVLDESQQHSSLELGKRLKGALLQTREILAFQPVMEAPLPEGFPQWTPVGEIRVQRYPIYRMARTTMSDGEDTAFWRLFKHIESNKIKMTAPVEVSYSHIGLDKPRGMAMAFLYSSTNIGQTASTGRVSVVNVPATTAVSIGVRGDITPEAVAAAYSQLKAWLADHAEEFQAAGGLRVLGYNSPMTPVEQRYYEVQVQVDEVANGK
jgi:hypothetical protein